MLPLLKLASDGEPHTLADTVERMAEEFQLSNEERTEALSRGQNKLYNRVGWTTTYLKKAGLIEAIGLGRFRITDRGNEVMREKPKTINVAFLESKFPELLEFSRSSDVMARMRKHLLRSMMKKVLGNVALVSKNAFAKTGRHCFPTRASAAKRLVFWHSLLRMRTRNVTTLGICARRTKSSD